MPPALLGQPGLNDGGIEALKPLLGIEMLENRLGIPLDQGQCQFVGIAQKVVHGVGHLGYLPLKDQVQVLQQFPVAPLVRTRGASPIMRQPLTDPILFAGEPFPGRIARVRDDLIEDNHPGRNTYLQIENCSQIQLDIGKRRNANLAAALRRDIQDVFSIG
jgi:hypothetical protein